MYKYLTLSGLKIILAIATALFLAAGELSVAASGEPGYRDSVPEGAVSSETTVRMIVVPGENTARYLVREQLAGFDFPNDAVGETGDITGAVAFNGEGEIIPGESRIVVNITGLTSDSNRRDGFIQRRTLESETYPTVELAPIQTRGLEFPLPASGSVTFDIIGHLTVRDVTEVTSWRVTARFNEGTMTGTARTEFTFDEFGMEKPSVASVLSVADAIRLEFDFMFEIEFE
jgi:polyisoprenoid-binding protein YceI